MKKNVWLAGTALALLHTALPAMAQEQVAQQTAQQQAALDIDELVVFGRGETRQVQTLGAVDMSAAAPGTSPFQVIQKLPGVSFQSADPFGAYEWALRISVRGFNQNQLGYTLDGVPLGDMSYGNHNGLHVTRAISSDNIGAIQLAQGAGSLDTASSSNLGGTLKFVSRDPSEDMAIFTQFTGGTENTFRPFVRVDSGNLGENGPRMFASYAYSSADKWKGEGKQTYHHANAKIVQPVGEVGEFTGYFSYSNRREQDYQDLSLDMIDRIGYDLDNLYPDYDTALAMARAAAANQPLPAPYGTLDDAYFDAAGLRKDKLGYVKYAASMGELLDFSAVGYMHDNKGQGSWITPYLPSPNGSPLSFRTTEYDIDRKGVVTSATLHITEDHALNGGIWYENNKYHIARRFYQMGLTSPERSARDYQDGAFATQFEYDFDTDTTQFHLQDTWTVTDGFTVNFGFKSLKATNEATPVIGTIRGTIKASDSFLPQAGMTFDLDDVNQFFVSYSENMRAFIASSVSGPFSTTQAGFDAIKNTLQPEKSTTVEGGWRFNLDNFEGVVAVYDVSFNNRLLSVAQGPGIVGAPSALSNVGSVSSRGIETGATWSFTETMSLFGSFSYNDAKYDDDIIDGNGVRVATGGKKVVDAPEVLAKVELAYDDGALFGRVGMSHTDTRYFTYLNDQSVPAYTLVDLSLGYRFDGQGGFAEGWEVQANITNVTDKKYVSTLGSNGFTNSGDNQTLQVGPPLQAFITLRKTF